MHAINWGIQVKKGLSMRKKKRHIARSKICQKRNNQKKRKEKKKGRKEIKKAGILIHRNWLQPHSVTSVIALVGKGCEEHWCVEMNWPFSQRLVEKIPCVLHKYPICRKVCSILNVWYVFLFLYQNWMIRSLERHLVRNSIHSCYQKMLNQIMKIMP